VVGFKVDSYRLGGVSEYIALLLRHDLAVFEAEAARPGVIGETGGDGRAGGP
jgi:hypothetical protein